jgi:N-acetyl-gamma-glutamyl-phosphate reductase
VSEPYRIGIVGARGHTGSELLALLARHPRLEVAFAGSRELAGRPVPGHPDLVFEDRGAGDIASLALDAVFLALPDGLSGDFVAALGSEAVIVDISADHRFDDAWAYGLPELFRGKIAGARLIANPGCYATVIQLAIHPFVDLVAGTPAVFGVSGYSGAGTTPSPRNDPENLADNLIPYRLSGHNHEREATRYLGRQVSFMPHVHPAFRGLLVTAHLPLTSVITPEEARERLLDAYRDEPLIDVQEAIPTLRDGTDRIGALIGGITVTDGGRGLILVAVEDNLLKGAAVQAVQNLNLALGLSETDGILDD